MQKIVIELQKSFDGRDSQWSGIQLFEWRGKRFGRFVFHLWDKDRTVKDVQYILPLRPVGTSRVYFM